jgi:hypothetical protein
VALAPADLVLDSVQGEGYPLRDWLTSYPLLLVAIDPYTHESSWILETAGRLLDHYSPADVRVGFLATTDDDGCRQFLGPWSESYLTFADPERKVVAAFEIERLPALVFVRSDGNVAVANGWDPAAWGTMSEMVSKIMAWSKPLVPRPGDPTAFRGTPALDG